VLKPNKAINNNLPNAVHNQNVFLVCKYNKIAAKFAVLLFACSLFCSFVFCLCTFGHPDGDLTTIPQEMYTTGYITPPCLVESKGKLKKLLKKSFKKTYLILENMHIQHLSSTGSKSDIEKSMYAMVLLWCATVCKHIQNDKLHNTQ